MLGPYGETLVLDWGMAKVLNQAERPEGRAQVRPTYASDSAETQAGTVMGTPSYIPPEVADGRSADADERTDVYLLGATLYHLLTGQPPRHGSSCEQVMELARSVPPPPPRKLKGDISRALEAICLKAMARRPQDRYAGTLDLAGDVQCYLAGAPVSVYREPVLARAWRWCKRHRRTIGRSAAGVLALGLLLLGAAVVRDAWNRADALQRETEQLRLHEQIGEDLKKFDRLTAERQFYAAGTTPAGERLLHFDSRRGEDAGENALAMADTLTEELRHLPSPDERKVFERELHGLLLLMVQGEAEAEQPPGPDAVEGMLKRLEQAASLQRPSRSYFHLRFALFSPGRK